MRIESELLLGLGITLSWDCHAHGQHVVRIETGIDAVQRPQTADHQPRADQQHKRESHFANNQDVARRAAARIRVRPTESLFQPVIYIRTREAPGGRKPGDQTGGDGNREGESQNLRVETNRSGLRQLIAEECDDKRDAAMSHEQTERAARRREQHSLREHLLNHSPPTRTERRADGNFFAPPERLRQHEIRDVGAGDQKYKRNRTQQHEKRRAHVSD